MELGEFNTGRFLSHPQIVMVIITPSRTVVSIKGVDIDFIYGKMNI